MTSCKNFLRSKQPRVFFLHVFTFIFTSSTAYHRKRHHHAAPLVLFVGAFEINFVVSGLGTVFLRYAYIQVCTAEIHNLFQAI